MTLLVSLLIALTLTVGVVMAVRQKYEVHRWLQTTAVILNILLVLLVMLRSYSEFVLPGVPGKLNESFYSVTTLHAAIGLVTLLLGLFIVLRANNLMIKSLQFSNYKRFMRTAYGLYIVTTLLGIWVYSTWYLS